MKNILCGTAAALALVAAAAPAAAQTSERHYANLPLGVGNIENPSDAPNFVTVGPFTFGPFASDQELADLSVANNVFRLGTRYTAEASAPADSETASPTVSVAFNLTGTVNKDCSFYSGNNANATNINFGTIGVRTGDNENTRTAFEMVGPAVANIETLTAGCNFNNDVEITKDNVLGLVNAAPGGYDTNEFQANIPYQVTASWTGVALGAVTAGSAQTLEVSTTDLTLTKQQGAWRSEMAIDIVAPAITNKGLVAGTYAGQTTLTLRAL